MAIPVAACVSYYMYVHDLSILLLPIAIFLNYLLGTGKIKSRYWYLQIFFIVLLLVVPTCLLFTGNQFWIASLPLLAFTVMVALSPPTVST
jgi:hypothetical protein